MANIWGMYKVIKSLVLGGPGGNKKNNSINDKKTQVLLIYMNKGV